MVVPNIIISKLLKYLPFIFKIKANMEIFGIYSYLMFLCPAL
jgi:hypothetical protein